MAMAETEAGTSCLPLKVEQFLSVVCEKINHPQPEPEVKRKLGLLTEKKAFALLSEINNYPQPIRTLNGLINCLLRKAKYQSPSPPSPSPSPPSKSSPTLFQTPTSASPVPQVKNGGRKLTDYYSCASPSKAARTSLFQGPSSAPPTVKPVRLFTNHQPQGETLPDESPVLQALGELEFRKQFLILNYAGGNKLQVLAPETIRSWKDLSMPLFETRVWEALGRRCICSDDRQRTFDWDSGKTYVYHCEVSVDGSYKFKGPYLNNTKKTLLQKVLGEDKVLIVKFADAATEKGPNGYYDKNYDIYSKVAREGILVGLRKYGFFVFKDGGNNEKKKAPTSSPVKCYFICVSSNAAIDRGGDYKLYKTIHDARCRFMHAHTVSSVSNYTVRFSLILSKTESLMVDWSQVKVDDIDDEYCLDEFSNRIYRDGKPLIHTDGTGFISGDLASLCPKDLLKKEHFSNEFIEPLLIQFRLFHKGRAMKGTFLVNNTLPPKTIQVRRSMVKVKADPDVSAIPPVNSLEIVDVSKSPRNVYFSRNLIALLCHGGVPKEYFMELLKKDLEDTRSVFYKRRAAFKVSYNRGEIDDAYNSFKMICSGIPLEEPYLEHRLSFLMKEEKSSLKKGKIRSPQSYNLMGTTDPTGILEKDEVCIILDNGHVSGEVLVYRHPGLHFGDVHVLKAIYVKEIASMVGNAKYAIFFSRKGPRSVADEMGGGDFDGDLYWISRNPKLLECFKPSEPWVDTSSAPRSAGPKPSQLLRNGLEDELFKLFLKTRFEPSFAMSDASDSWLATMDRYLTLTDSSSEATEEKTRLEANMLRLVDLYYDALDAPKKGRKVEVPWALKPREYPHYMEKKNSREYKSTSILGLIYDTVNDHLAEDASIKVIHPHPSFVVEVPMECLKKWKEHYDQYRSEMSFALKNKDKDSKNAGCDDIIKKYRNILYGADDFETSTRPLEEIFNEALAIHGVTYDYAWQKEQVKYCGFAWKVAGSALCKYYSDKQGERGFQISHSVLKDICS